MNIEFRFKHSLANIFKKEISELGFEPSKLINDEDVLHKLYERISSNQLIVTEFGDGYISGHISTDGKRKVFPGKKPAISIPD